MPLHLREQTPEQGFLTAHVTALLAKQNIKVTITFSPWTRITKSVQAGESGLVTQTRSEAPEQWTTRIPIVLHQNFFYTRSDSTWRYQGINSLKSLRLGIVENYGYEDKLDIYLKTKETKTQKLPQSQEMTQRFASIKCCRQIALTFILATISSMTGN